MAKNPPRIQPDSGEMGTDELKGDFVLKKKLGTPSAPGNPQRKWFIIVGSEWILGVKSLIYRYTHLVQNCFQRIH